MSEQQLVGLLEQISGSKQKTTVKVSSYFRLFHTKFPFRILKWVELFFFAKVHYSSSLNPISSAEHVGDNNLGRQTFFCFFDVLNTKCLSKC